jgi:hypothetical protein
MPGGPGLKDYIKAAFHAKPWGMPIPPNWILLAGVGILGALVTPGFLVLGAGLELGYLLALSHNPRFQKYVQAMSQSRQQLSQKQQLQLLIDRLWPEGKKRYYALQARCRSVLDFYEQLLNVGPDIALQHTQSLNKFVWIFLQLLLTRQAVSRILKENSYTREMQKEIQELENELKDESVSAELKKSLEGKRDIIKQRLEVLGEADNKLRYIDSELDRIEQQVELIREQAVVSKDAQGLSNRIDSVSSSLGETTDWIKEQQNIFGAVQDMLEETPPILTEKAVAQPQSQ